MKVFTRLIALLLTIACAVLLTLTFILVSPQGLHWAYRFAVAMLPGELSIAQLDGRLSGPLRLSGVHYHHDQTDVDLAQLDLRWHPGALVEGRLHIQALDITGLTIHHGPSSPHPSTTAGGLPDVRLPLSARIDHAALHNLRITTGDKDNDFILTSVELRNAAFHKGRLDLERLALDAPRFHAVVSGNLSPQRQYPLDLTVHWSADGGSYGTLAGNGRFSGNLRKIDVHHQLTSPLRAELRGAITKPLENLGWQGEISWPAVTLNTLNPAWPPLNIAGKVHGTGDLNKVEAEGDVRSRFQDYNVSQSFVVAYDHQRGDLAIRRLIATLHDSGSIVRLHGDISGLNATPHAELVGDWRDLRWPIHNDSTLSSKTGRFTLSGGLDDYRLQLAGDLAGPQVPAATWSVDAAGGTNGLTINRLAAQLLGGDLTANGRVAWRTKPQWHLALQAQDLNPAAQWPQWPGRLSLTAQVDGDLTDNGVRSEVKLSRLKGELKKLPVNADAALSIQGDSLHLSKLRIDSGGNHLTAAGSLQDQWNLAWQLDAADLTQMAPGDQGRLQGSGHVTGPRLRPTITASLAGSELRFAADRIGALDAVMTLDTSGRLASSLKIEAHDADFAERHFDDIRLHGDGTAQHHQLQLSITAPAVTLSMALNGGYGESAWRGSLQRLDLKTPTMGAWHLAAATPLSFQNGSVRLNQFCLQQEHARLCGAAHGNNTDDWQLQADAHDLPMTLLEQWLPDGSTLTGKLNAHAHAAITPGGPLNGEMAVTVGEGTVAPATLGAGKPTTKIAYRGGQLAVTLDGQALQAKLGFDLADGGGTHGTLRIERDALPAPLGAGHTSRDGSVAGQLQGELHDLSLLPAFIPGIEHTQGHVSSSLTLAGSLDKPRLSGELHLENGAAVIPALGIKPDAVDVVIRGNAQGHLTVDAQLRSKDGSLRLGGEIHYSRDQGWNVEARLKGDRAEIVNTAEYHILASPDLKLSIKGHRIDVEGEVTIPEANLRPRDVSSAVSPSNDVVIVNAHGVAPKEQRWQIYTNVRIRLGDFVKFNGFGLNGLLQGDFTLHDEPLKPTVARGELSIVNGEYRAYGQKLTVDRGRLLFFGGPVDNPGLDIRAVRNIQSATPVTAGIMVRGTIKSPQVQLFSEPAMAETDALSYLLTGQPMNQATSAQGQQLYGAALSLGLAGSGLLASQIGQRFGIDQLTVESGGSFGTGALVLRHYLSPKLYISYGVGLVERFNVFLMRYQISRRWALDATSGGLQSGADLVYTLERK